MNTRNNVTNRLERFLQTQRGKRFIHFAYSIGAAIVILGAMFKLLHFPFGNEMLFIGMTTEVIVFVLSAFDRPASDNSIEVVHHPNYPALRSDEYEQQKQDLNRTLAELNTVYKEQLKNISNSVTDGTSIEEETRRMAQQLKELNDVYDRMLQAMKPRS